MTSFTRVLTSFWPPLLLAVVAGATASVATVALLAVINRALHGADGLSQALFLGFAGLCGVTLLGRATSDIAINVVGQRLVADVRRMLGRQILAAPIDALERYRTHRLIPVLTHDVDMISDVAFVAAGLAISTAVVIGCLVYLAILSPILFALTTVVLVIGVTVQFVARTKGVRGFWLAREGEDDLHAAYRAITEGAKELRLNRARRAQVFGERIETTIDRIRRTNQAAINTFVVANAFGSALFFLVIALVFGWASLVGGVPPEVLSGFILVLLYMKGPVDQMMQSLSNVGRAQVAFRRIADVTRAFATPEPQSGLEGGGETAVAPTTVALDGVGYAFTDAEGTPTFTLGPIDLTIRRGEILFIVGDNGSGKTTLIKLLLGLYAPQTGQVVADGVPVTAETRDAYRQSFATVFADGFLFEDLIGGTAADTERAAAYLDRLEIGHKVTIRDGRFSTTDLSTGQRKRLALVQAYLEGRPVMVFDEWAADQDPTFRHVFYTEILPDLRRQGRTLVVISHDDRYFGVADRVAHMRDGLLVGITTDAPPLPAHPVPAFARSSS